MNLLFTIYGLHQPSGAYNKQYLFDERGGFIGRSDQCEWILPDKFKKISRKHAQITYNDGIFYINDMSSNGLFQALHHTQIVQGTPYKIMNGEGFIIGDFSIKATLMQSPSSYTRPGMSDELEKISQGKPFSLNPLQAMDQEEDIILHQRMGDMEDFLTIQKESLPESQSDHISPIHAPVNIVSTTFKSENFISEDWDTEPEFLEGSQQNISNEPSTFNNGTTGLPLQIPKSHNGKQSENTDIDTGTVSKSIEHDLLQEKQTESEFVTQVSSQDEAIHKHEHTDINLFFSILGFPNPPSCAKERQELLARVAELFVSMTDGLTHAMQHRAEAKNELRLPMTITSLTIQNNPLKYCPTAQAALAVLLGPAQKGVMPPKEAVQEAFNDLHKHHLGLLAGARAAVQSILFKLSPQTIDAHLETNSNKIFLKNHKRWKTFIGLHQKFHTDKENFANIFTQDFARAYEVQGKTLSPTDLWFKPKGEV